ncbi:adenylosuccinate synthase [Buchnera aphidicola (Mindarus keteleerifoliae)]|uniref:adenylosuccinate synthase n=1 Tax=Buchnera aphidicola TaxID=9 RepID=UPI0031B690BE
MNKTIVVLGTQWGDEGKGKIVDFLTENSDFVVRYQGGNNAGHTLIVNKKKIVLHQIPSGIMHKKVISVIGNGTVISPTSLVKEIKMLEANNICCKDRVYISPNASLILNYHISMDLAREKRLNEIVIGTTGKGIGPAYEDKISRIGIKIYDLANLNVLKLKIKRVLNYYNYQLVNFYKEKSIDYKVIFNELAQSASFILSMVRNVPEILYKAIKDKKSIIFEGAQGTLLDVDHGTYPYVTSSNSTVGGVCTGTGVGPKHLDYILGVSKVYMTRVGLGPFLTEVFDEIDDYFFLKGNESGSTTGRRRRTGWLDIVLLRKAIKINSLTALCLTKLDVLDELKEIKICIDYKFSSINSSIRKEDFIFSQNTLENITPIYETLPGWNESTAGITNFKFLPILAKKYINRIQELIGIPIDIISTGPSRDETIVIRHPFKI